MTPTPIIANIIISIVAIFIVITKSSNAILNKAKNLPAHALGEVQILRYAQDDITIYILRLQCITKSV